MNAVHFLYYYYKCSYTIWLLYQELCKDNPGEPPCYLTPIRKNGLQHTTTATWPPTSGIKHLQALSLPIHEFWPICLCWASCWQTTRNTNPHDSRVKHFRLQFFRGLVSHNQNEGALLVTKISPTVNGNFESMIFRRSRLVGYGRLVPWRVPYN